MTLTFTTMEQIEEHFLPNKVKRYPVVFRRRVTRDEAQAIDEWLNNHRRERI
jgi:phage-related protein